MQKKSATPKKTARKLSVVKEWPGALRPMIVSEPDHRIKSNLQRVASLLQLQAADGGLTRPDEALIDAATRIKAVAHWHAFLAKTRNGGRRKVALDDYLLAVAEHFAEVFAARARIVLLVNADPIQVPPRVAGMIGQIVSELIIDALRHAFGPKGAGTIQVECGVDADGAIALQVSDNGRGTANGSGLRATGTFGLQIVAALARQLGGRLAAYKPGARLYRVAIPRPGGTSSPRLKPQGVREHRA